MRTEPKKLHDVATMTGMRTVKLGEVAIATLTGMLGVLVIAMQASRMSADLMIAVLQTKLIVGPTEVAAIVKKTGVAVEMNESDLHVVVARIGRAVAAVAARTIGDAQKMTEDVEEKRMIGTEVAVAIEAADAKMIQSSVKKTQNVDERKKIKQQRIERSVRERRLIAEQRKKGNERRRRKRRVSLMKSAEKQSVRNERVELLAEKLRESRKRQT